jgi:hypothetical protein
MKGVFMKKTMGKKIEIIKENPVARALMGSCYRMKVKVSKKVYRRAEQRRNTRTMLKSENGPMRSLMVFSGLMGPFSPLAGSGNWLTVDCGR